MEDKYRRCVECGASEFEEELVFVRMFKYWMFRRTWKCKDAKNCFRRKSAAILKKLNLPV